MLDFSHDILKVVYTNGAKHHVEIIMGDPKTKEMYVHFMPCREDHPEWRDLLSRVSVDEIEEMTKDHRKLLIQNEQEALIAAAKEQGLVYEAGQRTPNSISSLDYIFNLPDTEIGTDFLFELKLRVFDMEQVMQSDNKEWKKKIRDSSSPIEVMYWAGKFLYE